MTRPQPKILLEAVNKHSGIVEQVIEAEAIWAVFYKDKPINLKSFSSFKDIKYKRFCFTGSGHAMNLAKRLNKQFNCQDFSVYMLTGGDKI